MQDKEALEKLLTALEQEEGLSSFGGIDDATKELMEKARKQEIDPTRLVEILLEKKKQ